MVEVWKEINDYEGLYEVSSLGRVRSLDRYVSYTNGQIHLHKGKVLRPGVCNGYLQVVLCKNGEVKHPLVHRLVAEAFIPNPDNLPQVNHKDENPSNNTIDNLEWCTSLYNINYGGRPDKVRETMISYGYWNRDMCGLDRKEYEKRKRNKIGYKEKHKEYNRKWREKKRLVN